MGPSFCGISSPPDSVDDFFALVSDVFEHEVTDSTGDRIVEVNFVRFNLVAVQLHDGTKPDRLVAVDGRAVEVESRRSNGKKPCERKG
jgi:hypothetical protein